MIDEKELLIQLQDKRTREQAFTMLMTQYQESVYWQIRRMVTNHEDADDILQNTFLKIWNSVDAFQGRSQLRTWIYRIAVNETLSFLEKRKKEVVLNEDDASVVADVLDGDPYFDGDETEQLLQEAVRRLPDKQRMVFHMKYFDEMKYEEISQILGTTVGALKASYHHAVKKICAYFEQND